MSVACDRFVRLTFAWVQVFNIGLISLSYVQHNVIHIDTRWYKFVSQSAGVHGSKCGLCVSGMLFRLPPCVKCTSTSSWEINLSCFLRGQLLLYMLHFLLQLSRYVDRSIASIHQVQPLLHTQTRKHIIRHAHTHVHSLYKTPVLMSLLQKK